MANTPNLNAAYDLTSANDHRRLYADWADSYDQTFIQAHRYAMPVHLARAGLALGGHGAVLDVGVGTGAIGEYLADQWTGPLHGIDLSPQMLAVARQKQIYAQLIEGNLLEPLDIPNATYDLIVSAGTFTLGHLGPEPIPELLRVTKPGGWFLLGINQRHYRDAGFEAALSDLDDQITQLTLTEQRLYHADATGDHADDLGWVCRFQKRP